MMKLQLLVEMPRETMQWQEELQTWEKATPRDVERVCDAAIKLTENVTVTVVMRPSQWRES